MGDTSVAPAKSKKHRSPTYPSINLQQAIKRAAEFYAAEGRNPASFRAAVKHWDYSEKSSGALLTASAVKSFGLLDELDSSGGRTFQISALGLKIVADKRPESPERDTAIREAALRPKIHAEIWRRYNGQLPSDAELQFRLENDWHFNLNAINPLIRELRDTIAFAKLKASDKVGEEEVEGGEGEADGPYVPKVGDFVQWEHNGLLGFPEPKRIREITSDGQYAYVDGQNGAIPTAELLKDVAPDVTPALADFSVIERLKAPPNKSMQEYVVPLADGAKAVFQWPVSLTPEDIEDLKDSLKILERKITRTPKQTEEKTEAAN
ncbi:MAG TPA: hypothetical protein VGN16_11735 [Acidobacteriaceae bacterium]|jgi:hypothetical protein